MDTSPKPPATAKAGSQTPFLETLRQEMDQMLERFRSYPVSNQFGLSLGSAGQVIPAIDVVDGADALEITAEMPGVEEDDLDITLSGDTLILSGEKKSSHEKKDKDYLMVERSYGTFRRQIPLGFTPEDDAVSASFDGGLLKLSIAKPAVVKDSVRKIKIGAQ